MDRGPVRIHGGPGPRIALDERAVVPSGTQAESTELIGDPSRRHFEPRARRIPAAHLVAGKVRDPAVHVLGRNGGRGFLDTHHGHRRRCRLRTARASASGDEPRNAENQGWTSHAASVQVSSVNHLVGETAISDRWDWMEEYSPPVPEVPRPSALLGGRGGTNADVSRTSSALGPLFQGHLHAAAIRVRRTRPFEESGI